MTPLLAVADVSFSYASRPVLDGLSLKVYAGTATALAGPNGAGKTTLLRILAGTLDPSAGTVMLDGRSLAGMPRKERSRLIALVPQQLDLSFDFTVEQIVEQGRTPYVAFFGGLARADRVAIDRALDQAGVASLRHRVFNELSGGERQRVKIALGLAQEPRLLLLDEPTQNLDIGRQAELMALLQDLREQGLTILASMHDLHLVRENFSGVHLLHAGGRMVSGTPVEVLSAENLMTAFGCSPGRHPMLAPTREAKEGIWAQ